MIQRGLKKEVYGVSEKGKLQEKCQTEEKGKNAQNPDRIFRSCLTGVLFRVPRASEKNWKMQSQKNVLFYDKMQFLNNEWTNN